MKRRRIHSDGGFSLIEALIATSILSLASAGVLLGFVKGAEIRSEGSINMMSANLANDLMELVLWQDYETILNTYNGFKQEQGQIGSVTGVVFNDERYDNFSREITCEEVYLIPERGDCEPKYVRVTVRVYYKGRGMISLRRLVCK